MRARPSCILQLTVPLRRRAQICDPDLIATCWRSSLGDLYAKPVAARHFSHLRDRLLSLLSRLRISLRDLLADRSDYPHRHVYPALLDRNAQEIAQGERDL